jgi:hypothetical protein
MLYVLIPIAWLLVASIVLAACHAAARADASAIPSERLLASPVHGTPVVLYRGLTLFEDHEPTELKSLSTSLALTRSGGASRLTPPRRVSGAVATGARVRSASARRMRCVT